jgi:hypothetical protein
MGKIYKESVVLQDEIVKVAKRMKKLKKFK